MILWLTSEMAAGQTKLEASVVDEMPSAGRVKRALNVAVGINFVSGHRGRR